MVRTPSCKFLICKLSVFEKQGIGQNRKREHIGAADVRNNLHEHFLMLHEQVHIINGKGSIREGYPTEKSFIVMSVKDRYIDKGALIDPDKWLIHSVNKLLETLPDVIIRIFDVVPVITVLLPEIHSPQKDIRDTTGP